MSTQIRCRLGGLAGGGLHALRELCGVELVCRTREDAEQLADLLVACVVGTAPYRLGLLELLLNAIEHGNLEIGGPLKARLLRDHCLDREIAARLDREPYCSRRVRVVIVRIEPAVEIEIRDDGRGFAWREALAAELVASDEPNGRGIALTRATCFPDLEYRDPGNVAVIRIPRPA